MFEPSPILNDERAASLLGTTPRRVRAWVRRGIIPGRQLPDGAVAIATTDLLTWLRQTSSPLPAATPPDPEVARG